jgi:hypothetical protein
VIYSQNQWDTRRAGLSNAAFRLGSEEPVNGHLRSAACFLADTAANPAMETAEDLGEDLRIISQTHSQPDTRPAGETMHLRELAANGPKHPRTRRLSHTDGSHRRRCASYSHHCKVHPAKITQYKVANPTHLSGLGLSAARGKQSPLAALSRVKGSEVHYESGYCMSALLWEGSVGTTRMKKTSAGKHKGETRSPNWRYSLSSSNTKGRPQTPTNRKQDVRDPEQCPFATSFSQQG